MKKIFTKTSFLIVLLLSTVSNLFAQTPDPYLFDDFEPGSINSAGICTDQVNTSPPAVGWNYNGTAAPTVVANPDKSGINTSNTVMYCVRSTSNVAWAGPKIKDAEWGTAFADTWGGPISGYNYIHIMMYCNQVTQPGVNTGGPDAEAMNASDITPYTWVDVVFDISGYPVLDSQIAILIDQTNPLTQESEVYLDNIILSSDPTPRTGTPTPPPGPVDPYSFDDFEPGSINSAGICTDKVNDNPAPLGWGWNGASAPSIVANPDKSGINTSNTVMYAVRTTTDVAWAGPKINDNEWGTAFTDTWGGPISGYNYMHIKMYCNQPVQPGINTGGGDIMAMTGTISDIYTWVDVVFDISAYPSLDNMIVIMVDRGTDKLTSESEVYIDDIILSNDSNPFTGITNVAKSDVSVYAANGILHISGSDGAVAVYNTSGQPVYQNTSAKNLSVKLAKGLYIVKAGATVKKVLIP